MSEIVVLKRTFVSSDRKRFPSRCQKRYARCGLPPERREPKTTSAAPRTIGSISSGTSAGSYSMSASWMTAISPSRCGIAARIAAPLPRFSWRTTTTPSRSRHHSSTRDVPSVEPSSTTTICLSRSSALTRSSTSPIVDSSLKAGTRNETRIRGSLRGEALGLRRVRGASVFPRIRWVGVVQEASPVDFDRRPILVFWETTKACALACRHCRASAIPQPLASELSAPEAQRFLEQLAGFGRPRPVLVATGGDVLMRPDLHDLVARAAELKLPLALAPSVTPLLTRERVASLRRLGVKVASISLDGATASVHDGVRGVKGHFEATLAAIRLLRLERITVQVNSVVMRDTVEELPAIARIVKESGASIWELFFLVQVRRVVAERVNGDAPPADGLYPRLLTTLRNELGAPVGGPRAQTKGTRDGRGVLFVGHDGEIAPSGFLPLGLGNVRDSDIVRVYREHPLLRKIRAAEFSGRCGNCRYRDLCAGRGSRLRIRSAGVVVRRDALTWWAHAAHSSQPLVPRVPRSWVDVRRAAGYRLAEAGSLAAAGRDCKALAAARAQQARGDGKGLRAATARLLHADRLAATRDEARRARVAVRAVLHLDSAALCEQDGVPDRPGVADSSTRSAVPRGRGGQLHRLELMGDDERRLARSGRRGAAAAGRGRVRRRCRGHVGGQRSVLGGPRGHGIRAGRSARARPGSLRRRRDRSGGQRHGVHYRHRRSEEH